MARPRDPRCDTAILEATLELVARVGLAKLTVDAIAAEACVSKATIYRRWDNKEAMVVDAWRTLAGPLEVPDTGALRGDLLAHYGGVLEGAREGHLAAVLPQVAAAAMVDEALAGEYRAFLDERRQPLIVMVDRAIARGELAPGTDVELIIDLVGGATSSRAFLSRRDTTPEQLERWVDVVLAGLDAVVPTRR